MLDELHDCNQELKDESVIMFAEIVGLAIQLQAGNPFDIG
jgi:hypothetical protein